MNMLHPTIPNNSIQYLILKTVKMKQEIPLSGTDENLNLMLGMQGLSLGRNSAHVLRTICDERVKLGNCHRGA